MSEKIPNLVKTSELKADYLKQIAIDRKRHLLGFRYDDMADIFIILLVPPETETVVHPLDKYVSLLYKPDTMDIVGIQIDDFEYGFLPKHEEVRRVWRLKDTKESVQDFGDIVLIFEKMKRDVVHQVVQATELSFQQLPDTGRSLKRAMELELV